MSVSDKEKKPIVHRAKFLLLLETIYQTASCCECLMKFTKLIKSDICIVFCCLAKISLNSDRVCYSLTPNTPMIQLWCVRSKLNMDEICSLNIHL